MRSQLSISIKLLLTIIICIFSSCEKHEGIQYFKSKCVAELNGYIFIDQTPFNIGPNSINTPSIIANEYSIEFKSILRNDRGGTPLYGITVILFVNTPWEYLTQPQTIKYVKIGETGEEPASWEYTRYCRDNQISYATILSYSDYGNEIIKDGTFEVTSYDKENKVYNGTFTLNFSEGTLNGEFSEVN